TNIVVVRHARISDLIRGGIESGFLALSEQPVDKVYESQAGNYRHRQEGLSLRIAQADAKGIWHPEKRVGPTSYTVSSKRRKIYDTRVRLAQKSHLAFLKAKEKKSFIYFYAAMLPLEIKYLYLNGRLGKGMVKSVYTLVRKFFRKSRYGRLLYSNIWFSMNKKVGLLTLPLKDNYGGILQAVALYSYLERMGCKVTLIQKEVFYPFWKKVLVLALQWLPFQNYKNFRSTRINSKIHKPIIDSIITRKTDVAITRSDLERMAFEYKFDAVVVGSDQVWRPQYTDRIYYGAYFLDFLGEGQTRRISYAASFGLDYWSDRKSTRLNSSHV